MYKEVTLDEAVALAKAGATIYRTDMEGRVYVSQAWLLFAEGKYALDNIGWALRSRLSVKVDDDG